MVQITIIAKNGNSTMLVLWGTIEMNVGITTTCIPTLSPLFKYFSDRHATPKAPKAPEAACVIAARNRRRDMELALRRMENPFDTSIDRASDTEEKMVFPGEEVANGMHEDQSSSETLGNHAIA